MINKKKEVTNEELARMVQAGFSDMDKRFEQVDKRFEQVDKRFETVDDRFRNIEAHLAMLSRDVGEIRQNFVYRHEFEDAMARVKLIENKLKIKSGK